MAVFALIMLVLALACFAAAALSGGAGERWKLIAAGLAFWVVISLVNVINSLT